MENQAYKNIVQQLISDVSVPITHIFDYETSPLAEIYDRFFDFAKLTLADTASSIKFNLLSFTTVHLMMSMR